MGFIFSAMPKARFAHAALTSLIILMTLKGREGDKTKQIIRSLALIIGLIATFPFTPQ
jgi:hypothetical protein